MLKFSEIFAFSRENSYFERIRMVRMVRMVRSLADRTFQLCPVRDANLTLARSAGRACVPRDPRRGGRFVPGGKKFVSVPSSWREMPGLIYKFVYKFYNFLAGSFSAVSKRNGARKYAFDSIFQSLQDLHPFAPLQSQNFRKKSV